MDSFFAHIDDVLAIIIVVGVLVLVSLGIDGNVWAILTMAAGYAFGKGLPITPKKPAP